MESTGGYSYLAVTGVKAAQFTAEVEAKMAHVRGELRNPLDLARRLVDDVQRDIRDATMAARLPPQTNGRLQTCPTKGRLIA